MTFGIYTAAVAQTSYQSPAASSNAKQAAQSESSDSSTTFIITAEKLVETKKLEFHFTE